jgi:integrase/recombinase XerD
LPFGAPLNDRHHKATASARSRRFAHLSNPSTRRAYENAVRDLMRFTGLARPEEFRTVTRTHIIAWREGQIS